MAWIPQGAALDLEVRFESVTEGVLVTATATAPVAGECARCLEPVSQTIKVRCQELFGYEQNGGDTGEDGYSLHGDLLDLEPVLHDSLNLEGITKLPDGRMVLVNDNEGDEVKGPTELLYFHPR